jgi:anti-anti-sigma factor
MITHIEIQNNKTPDGVYIFSFAGELDETNVDATMPGIIVTIGDFSGVRIVFDMARLTYLNSKSIGYIADISERIKSGNGKFALASLTPEVYDTLDLVGITSIVDVYTSQTEAISGVKI